MMSRLKRLFSRQAAKIYGLPQQRFNLMGAEVELTSFPKRERKLTEAIAGLKTRYDYISIGLSAVSLGHLTINAFTASDSVLIPVQCEY